MYKNKTILGYFLPQMKLCLKVLELRRTNRSTHQSTGPDCPRRPVEGVSVYMLLVPDVWTFLSVSTDHGDH